MKFKWFRFSFHSCVVVVKIAVKLKELAECGNYVDMFMWKLLGIFYLNLISKIKSFLFTQMTLRNFPSTPSIRGSSLALCFVWIFNICPENKRSRKSFLCFPLQNDEGAIMNSLYDFFSQPELKSFPRYAEEERKKVESKHLYALRVNLHSMRLLWAFVCRDKFDLKGIGLWIRTKSQRRALLEWKFFRSHTNDFLNNLFSETTLLAFSASHGKHSLFVSFCMLSPAIETESTNQIIYTGRETPRET